VKNVHALRCLLGDGGMADLGVDEDGVAMLTKRDLEIGGGNVAR